MNLTFTGDEQEIIAQIPIINDVIFEKPETFIANLMVVTSNVNTKLNSSMAVITIMDNDCEFFLQIILMFLH